MDNNFYTNLMAREHLRDASGALRWLMEREPECYERLREKVRFEEEELSLWEEITEKMYLPYDQERGIHPLDDGFLMRKPWEEEKIPKEKRAWLYENYHPLFIMRHRMSKQADAVLGLYLHGSLFTKEEIRRDYDFYQEVTLHHSSLSTCIFGIVACGIGYVEEAYRYFTESARMDLDDCHNNFYAGIHAANMAGTWQAVANGFGGMRCYRGKLSFQPVLPEKWEGYSFRVKYRGCLLEVSVTKKEAAFTLLRGERLTFSVYGEETEVKRDYGFDTDIVFSRPNYCKIDLMPEAVRGDNLFMQEDELWLLREKLAGHGIRGGLKALMALAEEAGREQGLKVKPTCDAKYLEVGSSSKSDNVDAVFRKIREDMAAEGETLRAQDCAFFGDEFVGIEEGIFGSDSFMRTELTKGGDFFDVSEMPGTRPEGVVHCGGGVERFLAFLREQRI